MDIINFSAKGEVITVFHTKQEWINKAKYQCSGFDRTQKLVFIDANGFSCNFGKNFTDAKYPVAVYRLITTSEKIDIEINGETCQNFISDNKTSSATKCMCGKEKFEHLQ